MASEQELRKKLYDDLLNSDVPSATKNVTVAQPKQEKKDALIADTAQKLLANRQPKQVPAQPQQSGGGIDMGSFGNAALNAIGNLKKSDIAGIMAGASTEKGNRDYGSAMGQQAAKLGEEEIRAQEAEALRNFEAQRQNAQIAAQQQGLGMQLGMQKTLADQALTTQKAQAVKKDADDFAEEIAKTLPPADAAKVRGLTTEQKLALKNNPDVLKNTGLISSFLKGPKARLNVNQFEQVTGNKGQTPPPPKPQSAEDIAALKAAGLM